MKSTARIEEIEVKNYRLFRHLELSDLQPLTVVIGANGSGKSTLFDIFSFLKESLSENVASAVARRGGFHELVSRGEFKPIEIVIKFREEGGRLATYRLEVAEKNGKAFVHREVLSYRRGQKGAPWYFVDFSKGEGKAITNENAYGQAGAEQKRKEYRLEDPSVLAIKGLGQFRDFPVVANFRNIIDHWYISNFQIADARPSADAGYSEHLSSRGDNVAQVARYLYEHHRERFDRIIDAMRTRVPGIENVQAHPTEDGRLVLKFEDSSFEKPFIARYVSDGTIKIFAYLVLMHEPEAHPLLAIEEPENQLYPDLLPDLMEEIRLYAKRGGQVFVSTHSTDLINRANLDEIRWLEKNEGFSTAYRASESELLKDLIEEGDCPGDLWRQGLIGRISRHRRSDDGQKAILAH
ncbi:AAA family ATPase [Thioalkalivibrio sp. HK1]|uniref:AAA family ATPase n=1 Tax=Thioalkalivibrio sp. HK1 TaxID=1469245 RepID=UPI000472D487|nr:AAA family ATPase [Thioalkalivibrio sp. HK1]